MLIVELSFVEKNIKMKSCVCSKRIIHPVSFTKNWFTGLLNKNVRLVKYLRNSQRSLFKNQKVSKNDVITKCIHSYK